MSISDCISLGLNLECDKVLITGHVKNTIFQTKFTKKDNLEMHCLLRNKNRVFHLEYQTSLYVLGSIKCIVFKAPNYTMPLTDYLFYLKNLNSKYTTPVLTPHLIFSSSNADLLRVTLEPFYIIIFEYKNRPQFLLSRNSKHTTIYNMVSQFRMKNEHKTM